jgi:hypothetical protein
MCIGYASGKLSDFIITIEHLWIILVLINCLYYNMYNKWHNNKNLTCHSLLLPTTTSVHFTSCGSAIYHISFDILSVGISFSFVNGTFYNIQFFHTPSDHNRGSSSHRNELTPRDSSGHSNHSSEDNMWASVIDYGEFYVWCDDMMSDCGTSVMYMCFCDVC